LTATYCTPEDVAQLCNLLSHDGERAVFGGNVPIPTREEVESLIEDAEEIINDAIGTAFGDLSVQIVEEILDLYCDELECAVHLKHLNVMSFDSDEGDKIECWYNNAWTDWLTTRTEGRGDDFWTDYKLGKIFFLRQLPQRGRKVIKATYRYNGGSTVPKAIKWATAFQVGIVLADSDTVSIQFPEGTGSELTVNDLIRRWEKRVANLLHRFDVSSIAVGLDFTPVANR